MQAPAHEKALARNILARAVSDALAGEKQVLTLQLYQRVVTLENAF